MKKLAFGALMLGLIASCGGGGGKKDAGGGDDQIDAPGNDVCGDQNPFGTCDAGQKCTWITDADDPDAGTFLGHVGCVDDGTVATNGNCHFNACNDGSTPDPTTGCADGKPAIGTDDCVGGNYCIAGVCQTVCAADGSDPACDDVHACDIYNNVYGTGDQTPLAGVCDATCDPLTQKANASLGSGIPQDACGSPTQAETGSGSAQVGPEVGCYESRGFQDFTCANTPFARGTIDPPQDRDTCAIGDCAVQTGQGTAVFTNGCAPGFTPGFVDATGSQNLICVGFCAPADSDNSVAAALSKGDATVPAKLPTDATPVAGHGTCAPLQAGGRGKTATEDCNYLWGFVLDNGALPVLPYDVDALGLCFDTPSYDYDPTGGSNATTPLPTCSKLQPGDPGDDAACGAAGACAAGTTCINDGCRTLNVACKGSADVDDADCYAEFHLCYSAVRTGLSAGSGSAAFAPKKAHVNALSQGKQNAMHVLMPTDTAKFRRSGGLK